MVPRLQKRGSSFKGVCAYILHDAGKATADRVDWTATQNLVSHPEDVWFEMFETYRDSDALKEQAGRSARGRKNTTPVLHYMLSWHKEDMPSAEHMRETALSSLKALGLQDHQAVLAAHHDKDHMHVHIVVNTVNPDNGITAPLMLVRGMRPGSVVDDDAEAELRRRLLSARVEHITDAGHSVQGDDPIALARLLEDFLPGGAPTGA